ncbi:MAG: heme ABC transporter permease [Pseudomonadales bacterium]|nr:heme ABC transporter permease [Pseudomonadales bacterium]MBO6596213.1 heme ABC transporter permease [Pseudomonadales bacterium]MBO6822693.1 heme ABC transporter permease [Pseudomonadales bacterium]
MNWFHRLGSPRTFFAMTSNWHPWLLALSIGLLLAGSAWALLFVPPDYQQGNTVRIMYIHVPAAILAQSGYMMMAGAAMVFLVWRIKLADMAMTAVAPLGASITFLALVTGAIWGKPTWGTWWVWDARLTSTLVLFFLYLGVMALRSAMDGREQAGRACAILSVVGVVNLPIIKYSVDWWYTLHQPASFTLSEKPAMPMEMWLPLLVMVIGYYLFFFTVWFMRLRNEILVREQNTEWVRTWVAER